MAAPLSPWLGVPASDPQAQFFQSLQGAPIPAAMPMQSQPIASSLVQPRIKPTPSAPPMPKLMPVVTPEIQQSIDAIKGQREKGQASALSQNDQLKAQLDAAMGRDFQTDLSPLAALVDEWSGSKIAGGYKAPETIDQRKAEISGLQGAIGKNVAGVEASKLQGLESDLNQALGLQSEQRGQDYKTGRDKIHDFYEDQKLQIEREKMENDRIIKEKNAKGQGLLPKEIFTMRKEISQTDSGKVAQGVTGFIEALNEYEDAVDKHGINPTGEGSAVLNSAYAKMSTRFKEAEKLGALSGPDLNLLKQNVANAGDSFSAFNALFKGGKEGIKAAIKQSRAGADNDFNTAYADLDQMTNGIPEIRNQIFQYKEKYNGAAKKSAISGAEKEDLIAKAKEIWLKNNGGK